MARDDVSGGHRAVEADAGPAGGAVGLDPSRVGLELALGILWGGERWSVGREIEGNEVSFEGKMKKKKKSSIFFPPLLLFSSHLARDPALNREPGSGPDRGLVRQPQVGQGGAAGDADLRLDEVDALKEFWNFFFFF